ncbi:MAG TPA: ferritin-like domain-containing protein [Myxococcota bacterium]|nr:ferritin-like domain-containing protein [Myxococcota bacterium]
MQKLIQEHRRRFGDFEVIDYVDESAIERLRGELDLDAATTLHWTWSYASEVAELRALYEKGKVHQWNAERDLDWSIPVSNDDWLVNPELSLLAQIAKLTGKDEATQKAAMFDEFAYHVSQLLHGEQAALLICGQLTNACHKMDEKWYAASQVADEARHIEAFSKFMQRKVGTIYPIGGTLKTLLDALLSAPTPELKTLGMQTLFEGMAVGIMGLMRADCRNPLLIDILERVAQDEARHAAFGMLTMRRILRDASFEQRCEMEDWSFSILEALNASQYLEMLRLLGPRYDVDAEAVTQLFVASPQFAEKNSLVYMHTVVPNLRSLGLITERTEAHWRRLGMLYEKDVRAA